MRPHQLSRRFMSTCRKRVHHLFGPYRTVRSDHPHLPLSVAGPTLLSNRPDTSWAAATVGWLADPGLGVDLVVVRGHVVAATCIELVQLCRTIAARGVHLDFHAAIVPDATSMRHLELAIDQIEARGLGVRVAGIDPTDPALAA